MNKLTFTHEGKTYERVSKRKAKKLYDDGVVIICPCNMRPFGFFGMGVHITNTGRPFESVVNEFEFYNCNPETGEYAAFYQEM